MMKQIKTTIKYTVPYLINVFMQNLLAQTEENTPIDIPLKSMEHTNIGSRHYKILKN